MYCQKCGAKLPENAVFCPTCGTKVDIPVVEAEVVDPKPKQEFRSSKYSEEDIKKMKRELVEHERRQKNFATAGTILLMVGIVLLIVGIVLLVSCSVSIERSYNDSSVVGIVFGSLGISFGIFMIIASIPLLVVASAVFGKKAENRRRAISEYEGE